MIVICEKCGKKYKLDTEKMPGEKAMFTCRICKHVNTITKPLPIDDELPDHLVEEVPTSDPGAASGAPPGAPPGEAPMADEIETKELSMRRRIRFGLRGKMILFFIIIPVALMATVSYLYMQRMRTLSGLITDESSKIVTTMAESIVVEKARAVARESKLYLDTHPNLKKEDFYDDPVFREITIQKVGETGYTTIVEKHNPQDNVSRLWSHPSEKLVGADVDKAVKKVLGNDFKRWYDITMNAFKGKGQEAAGYYMWVDKKEKFMAMAPVPETPFFIPATTYLDEFTEPMQQLQQKASQMTATTFRIVIIFLIVAAVLMVLVSLIYANIISGNVRHLTDITDQISVGNLTAEVKLKSKDELGVLAEAISRMQDSIRISLERIRRKK